MPKVRHYMETILTDIGSRAANVTKHMVSNQGWKVKSHETRKIRWNLSLENRKKHPHLRGIVC